MPNKIVHFEIDAEDVLRAKKFYAEVFGWKIDKWPGPMDYWMVVTSDKESDLGGALMKRSDRESFKNQVINTIGVESIDESIKKVKQEGGKLVTQKVAIPGIGYHATCLDTENNVFGLLESDMNAK